MASRRTTRSATKALAAVSIPAASPAALKLATKPSASSTPSPFSNDEPIPSASSRTKKPSLPDPLKPIHFKDFSVFDSWLSQSSTSTPQGIWLEISKKASGIPTVTYDQAVDVALCHGWIDGQRKSYNSTAFIQRFTPRRRGSLWSRRNVKKVASLVAEGRMRATGQAEVDLAKADGRWERAYAGQSMMTSPADFEAALDANELARDNFEALTKAQRYPFLWRVETAKKAETRARRIAEFVELLAQGQKAP